jgi:hypothetical protein
MASPASITRRGHVSLVRPAADSPVALVERLLDFEGTLLGRPRAVLPAQASQLASCDW